MKVLLDENFPLPLLGALRQVAASMSVAKLMTNQHGLVATGRSTADILALYPYLEADDIREALAYAAWRVEEVEVPLRRRA